MTTFAPTWPLQSDRLSLRPFYRGDLETLYAIHSDAEVARYLYNDPRTLEEVRELLERKLAETEIQREGDSLSAAVVLRQTGDLIGDILLHWVSETHSTGEIGFIIHPALKGNGYATEAARPVLSFAFERVGFHRVIGRTEARNIGSARVLHKLGMRHEAHLVENEWVKNEWQSELIYAMLAGEWFDQANRPHPAGGLR